MNKEEETVLDEDSTGKYFSSVQTDVRTGKTGGHCGRNKMTSWTRDLQNHSKKEREREVKCYSISVIDDKL
jgi:hypothetical protein